MWNPRQDTAAESLTPGEPLARLPHGTPAVHWAKAPLNSTVHGRQGEGNSRGSLVRPLLERLQLCLFPSPAGLLGGPGRA